MQQLSINLGGGARAPVARKFQKREELQNYDIKILKNNQLRL